MRDVCCVLCDGRVMDVCDTSGGVMCDVWMRGCVMRDDSDVWMCGCSCGSVRDVRYNGDV
jgi:hypothetical protein